MYSKALMHETCMQIWAGDKVHLQKHAHSNGSGWRHLTFFTTEFNKSENFASFRSRISERKGSRGTARTLFMSFSSFGSAGQLPRQKDLLSCFSTLLYFLPFLFPSFFLFWRQISRIKYGSHMLLLTIGIHHCTGPNATQTDGQKQR